MDADRLATVGMPLDGDQQKKINFMLQSGMMSSALKNSVPEQLFSTLENPVEGVSAVKALQLANGQGIPIYTVTQANLATVLPQLQLDAQVKSDIQNAVDAGKVVTVSKTDINFHGWTGCGYIIVDPTSGAGAYMIGGGAFFNDLAAYFAGLLDGLILQGKNIGTGFLKFAKLAGFALTFADFCFSVYDISSNDKLSVTQKTFEILIKLAITSMFFMRRQFYLR